MLLSYWKLITIIMRVIVNVKNLIIENWDNKKRAIGAYERDIAIVIWDGSVLSILFMTSFFEYLWDGLRPYHSWLYFSIWLRDRLHFDSVILSVYRIDCSHIDLDSMFKGFMECIRGVTKLAYFRDSKDVVINC